MGRNYYYHHHFTDEETEKEIGHTTRNGERRVPDQVFDYAMIFI